MYAKLVLPEMDGAPGFFLSARFSSVGVVQLSTNIVLRRSVSPALAPGASVGIAVGVVLQALRIKKKKTLSSLLAIDTCSPADLLETDSDLANSRIAQAGNIAG
jgi:hypothetical protein